MVNVKLCPYVNGLLCEFIESCDIVLESGVVVRRCSHIEPVGRRGGGS